MGNVSSPEPGLSHDGLDVSGYVQPIVASFLMQGYDLWVLCMDCVSAEAGSLNICRKQY